MTDLCLDHIAAANAAVPRNISTIVICFALRKFITRFAHKHFILIIITLNSHVSFKIIGFIGGVRLESYICRIVIHIID